MTTKELEREIWEYTHRQGAMGCFEVTIGWNGSERVDYMTYNYKDEFRCYEIKISKSDFHSRNRNTFVGHYNYFVLTQELYEKIGNLIPRRIGVYVGGRGLVVKPQRQELKADYEVLKNSLLRSLSREFDKHMARG